MPTVRLSLGSNMGNREQTLQAALGLIASDDKMRVLRCSNVWETEAVGRPAQPKFLNAVLELKTTLQPLELLVRLHAVEAILGRRRTILNGPRSLDIDILTYGKRRIRHPLLVVPHPHMDSRLFVLAPLAEVAPGQVRRVWRNGVRALAGVKGRGA